MDVSAAGTGGTSIYSLSSQISITQATASEASPSEVENDGDADDVKGAASVQVSQKGKLFSQLQSLSQSDPAKFKQVLTDAANALRADAQQQQGQGADFLNSLADRLQKAADSGDVSALRPSGGHGHHHHHDSDQGSTQGAAQPSTPAGAAYAATQAQGSPDGNDTLHQAIAQVMQNLETAVTAA